MVSKTGLNCVNLVNSRTTEYHLISCYCNHELKIKSYEFSEIQPMNWNLVTFSTRWIEIKLLTEMTMNCFKHGFVGLVNFF